MLTREEAAVYHDSVAELKSRGMCCSVDGLLLCSWLEIVHLLISALAWQASCVLVNLRAGHTEGGGVQTGRRREMPWKETQNGGSHGQRGK